VRVLRLKLSHFRGFEKLTIKPSGHVVLVGEPGAGRSDVAEALERVLWADSIRARTPSDLDFFGRDKSKRAEVEVVLGDLGTMLEQEFFDQLELWDREGKRIVAELGDPELIDRAEYDLTVRLCYRIRWNEAEDLAEHWVDYPKSSDPDAGIESRVPRSEREAIPFAGRGAGKPLDLSIRGVFRRLVEQTDGDDFAKALEGLESHIEDLAGEFSQTTQISTVLEQVLKEARLPLGLGSKAAADIVRFLPEGGSLGGLLRSLAPAVDLGDGADLLPLQRHGSTVAAILTATQSLAAIGNAGIVVVDDFGESLDAASSNHLASAIRAAVGQVWLSTRRSQVVEAFAPDEIVRLARVADGTRKVFYGRAPATKPERLAARHFSTQLLPAIASRAVVVVEGPHDRAALISLARRRHSEQGVALPSARGVTILDAGAADASGGSSAIPRLTKLARTLGFRTVALLDHDGTGQQIEAELEAALADADAVVRLPHRCAIEKALLTGLSDEVIRAATEEVAAGFAVTVPAGLDGLTGGQLATAVAKFLKQSGGLHAQFVDALPTGELPPLAVQLLEAAVSAATGGYDGLRQL
jgi:putative ATP-dependent endonuclease of OLD family